MSALPPKADFDEARRIAVNVANLLELLLR